jgi:hypothetical protein
MPGSRILLVGLLIAVGPTRSVAQWNDVGAFGGGAVLVGAQGFARPPITSAVASAYAHLPVGALLVGVQGGATFAEPERSHATYALATIAYAQRRGMAWQIYPFLGAGSGAFRTQRGVIHWRPAFAAGFGVDVLTGDGEPGTMLGARIGYITRSMADDESVAYAAIGLGFGGRKQEREAPRPVATRSR